MITYSKLRKLNVELADARDTSDTLDDRITADDSVAFSDLTGTPAQLQQLYYQATAPSHSTVACVASTVNSGDYWIDSDDNKMYLSDGSTWNEIQDFTGDISIVQGLIDDIAADDKITAVEKLTLKPVWDAIVTEATLTTGTLVIQAALFSVDDSDFDAAYAALYGYIITSLGVFNDMAATTSIVRATWDGHWNLYWDERTNLINDIEVASKAIADSKIQTFYQDSVPTAITAGDQWFDTNDGNKLYRATTAGDDFIGATYPTNGDMELDSNWADYSSPSVNERSVEYAYDGTYSRKLTTSGVETESGFVSDTFSTVNGKTYNLTYWAYGEGSVEIATQITQGDGSAQAQDGRSVSAGSWQEQTVVFQQTGVSGSSTVLRFIGNIQSTEQTFWIDKVSFQGGWIEVQDSASAQTTAESKTTTFYQDAVPTAITALDLWFDTNDGNKLYKATSVGDDAIGGGEWIEVDFSLDNVTDGSTYGRVAIAGITAGKIVAAGIDVANLAAIKADVGAITAGTLSSGDWAAAAGIRLDLTNKWVKMGGSNVTAAGAAAGVFLGLDTSYKFYVGDGSTEYFKFDGTNVELSASKANALTIKSGGDILLEGGGDLILTPDDSSPAKIIFKDSGAGTYDIEFFRDATNDRLHIYSTTTDKSQIYLGLGPSGERVNRLYLYSESNSSLICTDGTTTGLIQLVHNEVGAVRNVLFQAANSTNDVRISMSSGGNDIMVDPCIKIAERAAAVSSTAAFGQIWVKNTDPCELWFTDDAGASTKLA